MMNQREELHLYLLTGQSNMAGRGDVEDRDRTPHPRVRMLDRDGRWAPAVDPMHFDKPQAGVGLGSTFGREMAEQRPDAVIGLVPSAVGGTPMCRWQPGEDLYEAAVGRARIALADGVLKGMLWHQGENDAQHPDEARQYESRLHQMIRGFRADLEAPELPVVVGELGRFLVAPRFCALEQVSSALKRLPEKLEHTAWVPSADLGHKGDEVHFDADAQREFGRRYAQAMIRLQRQ